jgi:prepilin-type N-terminal cleavage/methylation domain-containing protein
MRCDTWLLTKSRSGIGVAMSYMRRTSNLGPNRQSSRKALAGFSLLELMVAMSVFLIMGGAVVALIRRHVPLFNTAQNQAGLNVTLRNAVAQLQMEVVNAGSSYSAGNPMPFWPIGATIQTKATPGCKATRNYVSSCFDSFSLIDADSNMPALAPSSDPVKLTQLVTDTGGAGTVNMYLTSPGNPAAATTAMYTAWAALLVPGTELMLVQGGTDMPAGQPSITVVVVQVPGASVNGNSILVPVSSTIANGVPSRDPMGIYDAGEAARFTGSFNPTLDYAIKLNATKYQVDGADITNPKLIRTNPGGTSDVIAEQVVAFNVGAWSSIIQNYSTTPASAPPAGFNSDWASVRSLQVQLIARTVPNSDQSITNFTNTYDQGPYQVQGVSVVINPRNLNTN